MKISVIGATGNIGSCAACNIAIHKVADEVVMIDDYSPDGLDQYAYDLSCMPFSLCHVSPQRI